MPRIWTQEEVGEVKESWKYPDTPINVDSNYDEEKSERRWRRFVFFDNLVDGVFITAAAVLFFGGFGWLFANLAQEPNGIILVIGLPIVLILSFVTSEKNSKKGKSK